MKTIVTAILFVVGCCLSLGCRCPVSGYAPVTTRPGVASGDLIDGYALLMDLMHDESRVDGVLQLPGKQIDPATAHLVNQIAKQARQTQQQFQQRRTEKPTVTLTADRLPLAQVEITGRQRIAWQTTQQFLFGSSRHFERDLLLTQFSAAQYAGALARAVAEIEPNTHRRQWLDHRAKIFENLSRQFADRLVALSAESAKK